MNFTLFLFDQNNDSYFLDFDSSCDQKMEKDLKNEAQKMISSATDQKDDAAMNEGGTGSDSSTTDQKGDDLAMNQGSAKMEEDHQKESGDDDVALNVGGTGSDSSTSHEKDVSSGDDVALSNSSTLLLPKKRKSEWVLAETSSKKRNGSPHDEVHTINLDAGKVHNINQSSHFID